VKLRFVIARRAEREIREASEWWVANRADAPLLFTEELESSFDFVEEFPYAGEHVPHVRRTVRRVLLTRVQYHLYYSIDLRNGIIEVLALWHTSRGTKPRL
jgi:plasmid stabilization system protein ParE